MQLMYFMQPPCLFVWIYSPLFTVYIRLLCFLRFKDGIVVTFDMFLHQTVASALGPGKIQKRAFEEVYLTPDLSVSCTYRIQIILSFMSQLTLDYSHTLTSVMLSTVTGFYYVSYHYV